MILKSALMMAAVTVLCTVGASCVSVRGNGGTGQPPEDPVQELNDLVTEFQNASRSGDFRTLRGIVTGEMQKWTKRIGAQAWGDNLADMDNEFLIQSTSIDSETEARSSVLFRNPATEDETMLEFTFLKVRGGWKIARAVRVGSTG